MNLLSPYLESDAKIAIMVMVVEEEASQDYMTKSSDECLLYIAQKNELQQFLDKWQDLTDSPGKTAILKHTIATGQHSPVRSYPYSIPESKQQNPYYMPLVEELIGKVGNCGYLSKFDLSKRFYQVEMEEVCRRRQHLLLLWESTSLPGCHPASEMSPQPFRG